MKCVIHDVDIFDSKIESILRKEFFDVKLVNYNQRYQTSLAYNEYRINQLYLIETGTMFISPRMTRNN